MSEKLSLQNIMNHFRERWSKLPVEEIPSDPQIRNLLDSIASSNFEEDFWFLLDSLKEQGHLQPFRTELNTYAIARMAAKRYYKRKRCPNYRSWLVSLENRKRE